MSAVTIAPYHSFCGFLVDHVWWENHPGVDHPQHGMKKIILAHLIQESLLLSKPVNRQDNINSTRHILTKILIPQNKIEPAHTNTYNTTCVTCKDSGQPVHPHSLIACAFYSLQGIQGGMRIHPTLGGCAGQSESCRLHKSYCRFCLALAQLLFSFAKKMNIKHSSR